jgi:hypothetical protein
VAPPVYRTQAKGMIIQARPDNTVSQAERNCLYFFWDNHLFSTQRCCHSLVLVSPNATLGHRTIYSFSAIAGQFAVRTQTANCKGEQLIRMRNVEAIGKRKCILLQSLK